MHDTEIKQLNNDWTYCWSWFSKFTHTEASVFFIFLTHFRDLKTIKQVIDFEKTKVNDLSVPISLNIM